MKPPQTRSVCWSAGRSVSHNLLKGREISLTSFFWTTCFNLQGIREIEVVIENRANLLHVFLYRVFRERCVFSKKFHYSKTSSSPNWAAIGCTENGQPMGLTVLYEGEGWVAVDSKKTQFS